MSNQIEQVRLITESIVQATKEMKVFLETKDLANLNELLSSYVTALQTIQAYFQEHKNQTNLQTIKVIQVELKLIIQAVKQEDVKLAIQMICDNLIPSTKKLRSDMKPLSDDKEIIIGVYHADNAPALSYNNNRLKAMYEEATKQNCKIYMFESSDVDMTRGKIKARNSMKNLNTEIIDLPDVIYNIFPKINYVHDEVESWLRKKVPFTSFPINNKIVLPQRMQRSSPLGNLFIPFIRVSTTERILQFLDEHGRGILKRYAASRGESIYYIEKTAKNAFELQVEEEWMQYDESGIITWIEENIIGEKYILQEFKELKTKRNEPFDIRAHMQKDGERKWTLTKMYPRIGKPDTILSNISQGGRTLNIETFLQEEYGAEKAAQLQEKLATLSIDIVTVIDDIYNQSLDELGLDLAIDQDEKIWMHEANVKPRMRYYEAERAVNTIAYLKYVAKNKLFMTNDVQEY